MMGNRRMLGRAATVTAAVVLVMLGTAAAAPAGKPTGEFARFQQCPRFTAGVNLCLYAETLGGKVTIGKRTVQIERPIVLQGGIVKSEWAFAERFVGALDGETFSHTPERVPGGLLGSPLYVVLELIPPANEVVISLFNLENRSGAAIVLPARMRLESSLLGGECYIGSRSHPVVLRLTSATTSPNPPNVPISGKVGQIFAKDEFELFEVIGDSLVDNAFSAPGATGCGSPANASFMDSLVDHELGLPSPDGYNTIVQLNTVWEATTVGVIASEAK
jgi:hypothetical protein